MNELWRHRNTHTNSFNVSMLLTINCTNTHEHSTNNYTILYHMNTLYNMTSFSKQMFVSIWWGNPSMDLKILRFCRAVRPSSSRVSSFIFSRQSSSDFTFLRTHISHKRSFYFFILTFREVESHPSSIILRVIRYAYFVNEKCHGLVRSKSNSPCAKNWLLK